MCMRVLSGKLVDGGWKAGNGNSSSSATANLLNTPVGSCETKYIARYMNMYSHVHHYKWLLFRDNFQNIANISHWPLRHHRVRQFLRLWRTIYGSKASERLPSTICSSSHLYSLQMQKHANENWLYTDDKVLPGVKSDHKKWLVDWKLLPQVTVPIVASQKFSRATSLAILAPMSTAHWIPSDRRIRFDIKSRPFSFISRPLK